MYYQNYIDASHVVSYSLKNLAQCRVVSFKIIEICSKFISLLIFLYIAATYIHIFEYTGS
jgi:hypothetical protein